MSQLAITVIGQDRPGIIAEATSALAAMGVNIEDSTMTLLRGHFAMMLITAAGPGPEAISAALSGLAQDGTLSVDVRPVPDSTPNPTESSYLVSVHGGDRPGIVFSVLAEVARVGGNVTDLSTRLAGDFYVLLAECELPAATDVKALQSAIGEVAAELGVGASLRPIESDDL